MITYQDFIAEAAESGLSGAIERAIREHEAGEMFKTAVEADLYDRQRNSTINRFVQRLFTSSGASVENFVASNNKKASNFFNLLNTQRNSFLLGNGVSFPSGGQIKEKLGADFDSVLLDAGYYALIHGVCYLFYNAGRVHVFRLTEFVPLHDEETGVLRAGVRYWSVERGRKPVIAVLYEESGVTRLRTNGPAAEGFEEMEGGKEIYKTTMSVVPADGRETLLRQENYGVLPVVPLYGSRLRQSTLVGMKESIDSYDIIANGWCNDVRDCAQVYWILENYAGMSEGDLAKFRDRLLTMHIAAADVSSGGAVRPYTQEVPHQSRDALLTRLKEDIYRDFGALDPQAIASGSATATAIRAAYEALNQKADDFEMQIVSCVQELLRLIGIKAVPVFKRSIVVNEAEQVDMLVKEAGFLDEETILRKLPNLTVDEVEGVLARRRAKGSKTGAEDSEDEAAPGKAEADEAAACEGTACEEAISGEAAA